MSALPRWGQVRPPVGSRIISGHSLAQDLVGAWLFDRAVYDLTGRNLLFGALTSATYDQRGIYATANGGRGVLRASKLLSGETNLTMMAWAWCTGTPAAGRVAYCERGSGGNDILKIGQRQTNAGAEFTWRNNGGTLKQIFGSRTINDGMVHQITGRQRSTTDMHLFVDGFQEGSAVPGTLSFTDADIETWVAGDKGDSSAIWSASGSVLQIYAWRRALSDEEIRWLSREPYAFIQPPAPYRRLFLAAAAAPPPDTSKFFAVF